MKKILQKVIRDRPVAILLPGTSIKELEERITELKDADICYASVNDFWIMEEKILSKIGKQLEIVLCSAKECNVPSKKHDKFLDRENVAFLTEDVSFHHSLDDYMDRYKDKLCFFATDLMFDSLNCPSPERPYHFFAQASFVVLLSMVLIGGAETVILFGADGGDRFQRGNYYGGWRETQSVWNLGYDTGFLNATIFKVLENVCVTHGVSKFRILNCSPGSYYCAFNTLNYDMTFKFLRTEYAHLFRS